MAERLNLKLSAEEVKQAKTDRYIVDRLKSVIHMLKRGLSKAQHIDLHVILGAVAPEQRVSAMARA